MNETAIANFAFEAQAIIDDDPYIIPKIGNVSRLPGTDRCMGDQGSDRNSQNGDFKTSSHLNSDSD